MTRINFLSGDNTFFFFSFPLPLGRRPKWEWYSRRLKMLCQDWEGGREGGRGRGREGEGGNETATNREKERKLTLKNADQKRCKLRWRDTEFTSSDANLANKIKESEVMIILKFLITNSCTGSCSGLFGLNMESFRYVIELLAEKKKVDVKSWRQKSVLPFRLLRCKHCHQLIFCQNKRLQHPWCKMRCGATSSL